MASKETRPFGRSRAGFNNPAWDREFLDLIEKDPERLTEMTQAEYAQLGGWEGAEVIMWLVMRGALPTGVQTRHRGYYLPSMTGIGADWMLGIGR